MLLPQCLKNQSHSDLQYESAHPALPAAPKGNPEFQQVAWAAGINLSNNMKNLRSPSALHNQRLSKFR